MLTRLVKQKKKNDNKIAKLFHLASIGQISEFFLQNNFTTFFSYI